MAYWGSFSSCYQDLEPEQVEALERAIRFYVLGQYNESEAVFSEPSLQAKHLLIAIERSNLYERIGLERQRSDILSHAVNLASYEPDTPSELLYDLACLLRSNAEFFAYGLARSGARMASIVATKLESRDTADMSDIEVRCLLECHKIFRECKRVSNWFEDKSGILYKSLYRLPAVAHLRITMQNLGKYMLAVDLIKSEQVIDGLDDEQYVRAYQDFLRSAIEALREPNDEAVLVKLATLKIFYSQELSGVGRVNDADIQLEQSQQMLYQAARTSKFTAETSPRMELLLARARCSAHQSNSVSDQIEQDVVFEKRAERLRDFCIQRVHLRRAVLNSKHSIDAIEGVKDPELVQAYHALLERYIKFESDTIQDAYYYTGAVGNFGIEYGIRAGRRPNTILELVQDFEGKFPRFEIPQSSAVMMNLGSLIAKHLGHPSLAASYKEKAIKWHLECPGVSVSSTRNIVYTNLTDDNYFQEWRLDDSNGWCEEYMTICMRTLLRYVATELAQGLISEEEAKFRVGWHRLPDIPKNKPLDTSMLSEVPVRNAIFGVRDARTGKTRPTSMHIFFPWMESTRMWLLKEERPPSKIQRQYLLYQIARCRAQSLSDFAGSLDRVVQLPYVKLSVAAQKRCLELEKVLDRRVVSHDSVRRTAWCVASDVNRLASFVDLHGITDQDLSFAAETFRKFEVQYTSERDLLDASRSCAARGRALLQQWGLFKTANLDDCLASFAKAESLFTELRREYALSHASRSFMAKSYLTEWLGMETTNSLAIYTCVLSMLDKNRSDLQRLEAIANLFSWTQKSKARSLTDLMGLVAAAPGSIMTPIKANPYAVQLLDEDNLILKRLQVASPLERITIRSELEQQSAKMRREAVLTPLLDLRDGVSISAEQLSTLGKELNSLHHDERKPRRKVLIFEWVYFQVPLQETQDLLLLVYVDGKLEHRKSLDMKLNDAEAWVDKELGDPAFKDRPLAGKSGIAALMQLEQLVEPILDLSDPDDTLVFCPTRALHRIPLHALAPRNILLIDRNPILYCQSLSLLRLCHEAQLASDPTTPFNATVLNTLEYPSGIRVNPLSHIDDVASILDTHTIQRDDISKPLFRERVRESCITHVHGHIEFDADNPLQHHLVLHHPTRDDRDKYTADEIFDTPLHKPSIILAMGCNSGRSKPFECDDLLGLTAAFHYSGASSVISTLWPIVDADCIRFSKAFYSYLMQAMSEIGAGPRNIDVAAAFQQAVLAARKNEKGKYLSPNSWAAFHLHGSGLFPKFRMSAVETEKAGIPMRGAPAG